MSKVQTIIAPVRKTVEVKADAAKAFDVFTARMASWWPMKTHSRAKDAAGEVTVNVAMEPRAGGRLYETLNTGEEREWGVVKAYEPGKRVMLTWIMGTPQPTEIEVTFEQLGEALTRVTLEHRLFEVLGEDGQRYRDNYNGGWATVFEKCFAAAFAG